MPVVLERSSPPIRLRRYGVQPRRGEHPPGIPPDNDTRDIAADDDGKSGCRFDRRDQSTRTDPAGHMEAPEGTSLMTLRTLRGFPLRTPAFDAISAVHLDVIAVEVVSDGPFGQGER
jgi:hypothetical protein